VLDEETMRTSCVDCEKSVLVPEGTTANDALWLHKRRCTGSEWLAPELSVVCDACTCELAVTDGLDPFETLWMHDLECTAALERFEAVA
jgi:hypothetical protein